MPNRSNDPASYASDRRRRKGEPTAPKPERPTNEIAPERDRAVLIGIGPAGELAVPDMKLDELGRLACTAGAVVVGRLYQHREQAFSSTYLGTGKLEELAAYCLELEATIVIADDDLTPAQVRHIEAAVNLRVIDRSELIIDIFVLHAGTQQARLQVELAQLEYLAPRLKRMWTHLSRITGAGGIGSRGPGEKQIEVDRRLIQRRIRDLKRDLLEIEQRRERQVASRGATSTVALVGYTNAGKSTLMRTLTGADVFVADQLFATLETKTRRWNLPRAGLDVLLSDTVGFIDKLPHHLVASFQATLEEVRTADLLLHVADASDPDVRTRIAVVNDVLARIGAKDVPTLLVLNKIDLLDPFEVTLLAGELGAEALVSAHRAQGIGDLEERVLARLPRRTQDVDLVVPSGDGATLAALAREGFVHQRTYEGENCHLRVTLPDPLVARYQRFRADESNGSSP